MLRIRVLIASVLSFVCFVTLSGTAEAQAPGAKPVICVTLPGVQLGQGTAAQADPAGPIVNSMLSYLAGPAADVQVLQSKAAVQIAAEAAQKGCGFVLESEVTHKKASKAMAGLLAAAPALMSAVPLVGGGAGSYAAAQVASAAAQGAAAAQSQQAQQDAMAAMSGVAQSNIKKGDQVMLSWRLLRSGSTAPVAAKELKAKAEDAGQDVLSPLLEQMANDVLTVALTPAS